MNKQVLMDAFPKNLAFAFCNTFTAQVRKFSIKNRFSKFDLIRRKLQVCSHLPIKNP